MDDGWFSDPNEERDIVIPDFIKTEIQTFDKERRCIAMMFARIFKKFNFDPHPVSFDMKMYIDGNQKLLPKIAGPEYNKIVQKYIIVYCPLACVNKCSCRHSNGSI